MIFDRPGAFIAILRGKNLYQEFLVSVYIYVERSRLNFIWFNQAQLKANIYKGLQESFRDDLDIEGRRVILPSSFSGSPRSMLQLYQDSMASVWQFGKPLLFITMTANAHWPKINAALKPGETPSDRPDLVTRVFCMKLKTLINDVVRNHHLGIVASYVYTIEFQKRGLPHGHIMVILEPGSVPRTPEEIDCLVTAKIPDPNQEPLL
jgi:hypothetical protein